MSKGDKKKKKEITEKIATLQAELDAKHEKELTELKEDNSVAVSEVIYLLETICLIFSKNFGYLFQITLAMTYIYLYVFAVSNQLHYLPLLKSFHYVEC